MNWIKIGMACMLVSSFHTAHAGAFGDFLKEKAKEKATSYVQAAKSPKGEGFSACADFFPNQKPLPTSIVPAAAKPRALCFSDFAVLHSGASKTPVVTIEKLNAVSMADAKGEKRTDRFYPEARLPSAERASLADYASVKAVDGKALYDRGHMAAAANRTTPDAMAQSFSLANMVPQNRTNNREIWAKLESDVRKYASRAKGNVYVYSGPMFDPGYQTIGSGNVWVPTRLFKLMYDEQSNKTYAWIIPNTDQARIGAPMSYNDFKMSTGMDLLGSSNLH